MEAASGVLVGSGHTARSLWAALPELPQLQAKTRLGPPGVDIDEFHPLETDGEGPRTNTSPAGPSPSVSSRPVVAFVGKLIVSKGVDLLIAAWPLVRAAHPRARLRIAGFGEYEGGLRRLLAALDRGDLDDARQVARLGWALEGGERKPLPILSAFLADPPPGYLDAARGVADSIDLLGRLEHEQVAALLPRSEALVMPSTFPEAFGMVAVEAAACGALPLSAGHSGMLEVSQQLAAALPEQIGRLLSFTVETGAVEAIAERLDAWLALPAAARQQARETLVATVARLWSWDGVARGVLAASAGELAELPQPA
jgi:glycosyltransferase involved in cell wall biosynthesis